MLCLRISVFSANILLAFCISTMVILVAYVYIYILSDSAFVSPAIPLVKGHKGGIIMADGVSPASGTSRFLRWRWILYISLFFGWCCYYFCRKSFPSSIPNLIADNGLSKDDVGAISSSFAVAYGLSKFFNSLLSDHVSARKMFSMGLVLSGLGCLLFPFSAGSVPISATLWFMEGVIQGLGWAPCAKLLKVWYPPSQMGTWWSVLSSAGNVAAGVSPLLITYISSAFDWRVTFYIIGVSTVVLGLSVFFTIKDSPSEVGVELAFQKKRMEDVPKHKQESAVRSSSMRWYTVLLYKDLWVASIGYAVLSGVKTSVADWSLLYFMQTASKPQAVAAACVGVMQFGAIVGLLCTGYISDLVMTQVRVILKCVLYHIHVIREPQLPRLQTAPRPRCQPSQCAGRGSRPHQLRWTLVVISEEYALPRVMGGVCSGGTKVCVCTCTVDNL